MCPCPSLKPYPTYKPSGIEWLGDVPAHWEVPSVKQHYDIQLGKMLQPQANSPDDIETPYLKALHVQWDGIDTVDPPTMWASPYDIEQFGVKKGDLLVCEGGEGGRCSVLRDDADGLIIQNALHRVRPRKESCNDFLQYTLRAVAATGWFDALNDKATIAHFTRLKFSALRIPLPPLAEQRAIARYLDHMDGRIQRYISGKERLIGLLEEEKRAVINEAVTRGLDPDVRLKASGVEWLGDVPAHWGVRRLKQVCRFNYGDSLLSDSRVGDRYAVYGSNGPVGTHKSSNTHAPCVVIGRKGSFGKVNFSDNPVFAIDTTFFVDDRSTKADLKWLFYALSNLGLDAVTKDSAIPGLDREEAYAMRIPYCNATEQRQIVEYLDKAIDEIGRRADRVQTQIELIKEYRTRLIADVVTGKLDVRDAAAGLPDYDEALDDACDSDLREMSEVG